MYDASGRKYQMRNNIWIRFCLIISLVGVVSLLTGCGTDLTDEQNRIIAEYAADLLLEYDEEYQAKYGNTELEPDTDHTIDTEDINETEDTSVFTEDITEEITTEEITEEPGSTEDLPTEELTTEENDSVRDSEEDTEASTEDSASAESASDQVAEVTTEENTDPPVSNDNVADIAEIVGISGLSITYSKLMFLDRYPSIDQDGAFIYLDADPGYKLAVMKFNIVNNTSDSIMLDLLNTDIDYRLVMNQSKAAKPMLTILMDDLGTFSNSIPGGSDQSAVLVYQISESSIEQIQNLDLKVTYNNKEYVIHIQ